jgi:hypothetical protein
MTPQRTFAGVLVVAVLTAAAVAPVALADPAGTEYLPSVPKPNHHKSSGSGSTSTEIPTDTTSAPVQEKHKKKPEPKRKKKKSQAVQTAPFETVANGSEASFLPVILLITGGVFLISAAMVMRRRTRETVAFDVPEAERLWPERKTARPTPEGEIFAGHEKGT